MILHGEDIFDAARVALFNRLNDSIDALRALDPKIDQVYATHSAASIGAPSASIDIDSADQIFTGATHRSVQYNIHASVRVHSVFETGFFDPVTAARVANSILNMLRENPEISSAPRLVLREVEGIRFRQAFTDTGTVGTEIIVRLEIHILDEVTI